MAQLAIKGHETRGKEVIEILEMLGGSNPHNYCADCDSLCFTIGKGTNIIYYDWVKECYEDEDTLVFTLEDFLEKYPYKVGDKVGIPEYESEVPILSMNWNGYEVQYEVFTDETEWYSAEELNKYNEPYKEETMEERPLNTETYFKIFDNKTGEGYEVFVNDEYELKQIDGHFYINKKKSTYPKTYEECCRIIDYHLEGTTIIGYEKFLLENFQQLLICRDAYWKIAGEKMGLGKPWEPDWTNPDIDLYVIINIYNRVEKAKYGYGFQQCILTFPTEEMRDAFYENFKDLIEQCKELL